MSIAAVLKRNCEFIMKKKGIGFQSAETGVYTYSHSDRLEQLPQ